MFGSCCLNIWSRMIFGNLTVRSMLLRQDRVTADCQKEKRNGACMDLSNSRFAADCQLMSIESIELAQLLIENSIKKWRPRLSLISLRKVVSNYTTESLEVKA